MPPSTKLLILTGITLLISLLTLAHLHPSTSFKLPFLPSPWRTQPHIPVSANPNPNNRQLSYSQCQVYYPDLYLEADRARDWHRANGGISLEDVEKAGLEEASARVAIIDNKVGTNSTRRAGSLI
jgi:hypothetical protein